MKRPDTPFARHWLSYIVLKYRANAAGFHALYRPYPG
jgi:hypothetical protein